MPASFLSFAAGWNPRGVDIDEVYRFKEDLNPDNNVVVNSISSTTGVKGMVIDS